MNKDTHEYSDEVTAQRGKVLFKELAKDLGLDLNYETHKQLASACKNGDIINSTEIVEND
jgi:phage antirepressor YoqD-like protein